MENPSVKTENYFSKKHSQFRNLKLYQKILIGCLLFLVVYWTPFIIFKIQHHSKIITSINELPQSDAVVVFGARMPEDGTVNAISEERLKVGMKIYSEGKAEKILVSNTEKAAQSMANYLQENGIPKEAIEIDTEAVVTTDTCTYEFNHYSNERRLIYVSQGFHLDRLLHNCEKEELKNNVAFKAESLELIDRSQYSWFLKFRVRSGRYIREAFFDWLSIFGVRT